MIRITDILPDFARDLERGLLVAGEEGLSRSISELQIVERCTCREPGCVTFYSRPKAECPPAEECQRVIAPAHGVSCVQHHSGQIVWIEALGRPNDRKILDFKWKPGAIQINAWKRRLRQPSPRLLENVRNWIADARSMTPGALNKDGSGVAISGDFGAAAYIRTDGSIEIELDEPETGDVPYSDPDFVIAAVVCAARRHPILAELLPIRPTTAFDCAPCNGAGWANLPNIQAVCHACFGLGWQDPG